MDIYLLDTNLVSVLYDARRPPLGLHFLMTPYEGAVEAAAPSVGVTVRFWLSATASVFASGFCTITCLPSAIACIAAGKCM